MLFLFSKIIFLSLFIVEAAAQFHYPTRFSLKSTAVDSFFQNGLSSNIIAEVRLLEEKE